MKNPILFLMILSCSLVSTIVAASPDKTKNHHAPDNSRLYGKVVQSMDANNYTYVQINTGSELIWAAGPKTPLKKGNMIALNASMPFTDFESKTLNRKFKKIYFVNRFVTDQKAQHASMADPHAGIKPTATNAVIQGIKKLSDGKSVAEVYSQKKELAGKGIKIRGKVVKYTGKVMGKNWLHIQDSSGTQKLVITTEQEVKIGDMVVVNGIVAVDQELGHGYRYDVMIERAIVTVE